MKVDSLEKIEYYEKNKKNFKLKEDLYKGARILFYQKIITI